MNSHRTSQNKKLFRIFAVSLVCLLSLALVPVLISGAVSLIAAPINMTKTWVQESGSSLPQYFRNRATLISEISQLRSDLASTNGDRFNVEALAKENLELRDLLGYAGEERTLAGIIGRPGDLPYDALMIDQGSTNGIVEGAPVYIGGNTVIGLVKNVTAHASLVELVTSPGFEATVYIIGPDIYTNAVGMGGGQLRVGVPQGISLSEGDLVVLPSVASGVYGAISTVQSEATRPEQYGFVSPKTPLASIRLVSVGKNSLRDISFEEAQKILSDTKTTLFTVPVPEHILVEATSATSTATSSTETTVYEN